MLYCFIVFIKQATTSAPESITEVHIDHSRRLSRANMKTLALGLAATASFTFAAIETNQPDLDGIPVEQIEKFGEEAHDPVDTTLKAIGLACALGIFNVKRPE